MMRSALAAAVLCILSFGASAQVYVWKNGTAGSTHMASSAPAWYRNGVGPRTQLLVNGVVIDDTAWKERAPVIYVARQVISRPDPRAYASSRTTEPAAKPKSLGEALVESRGTWGPKVNEIYQKQFDDGERKREIKQATKEAIRDCRDGFC